MTENERQQGNAQRRKSQLPHAGPNRRLHPFYSNFVRLLKVLLPFVALLLVATVVAWPYLQREGIAFSIGFATGAIIGSDNPVMVNPRYTGIDDAGKPFSITADLAHNLVMDTTNVDLEMPKADVTMADGTWLVMTAKNGLYDRQSEILDLEGGVNLFHDQGYELNTEAVRIVLSTRFAESVMPVSGHGPIGDIQAEGLQMDNLSRVIIFTGKSRMLLYPDVMGGQP